MSSSARQHDLTSGEGLSQVQSEAITVSAATRHHGGMHSTFSLCCDECSRSETFALQDFQATSARGKWCHMQ